MVGAAVAAGVAVKISQKTAKISTHRIVAAVVVAASLISLKLPLATCPTCPTLHAADG